jgi:Ribbon-helix-helix protein, copG family
MTKRVISLRVSDQQLAELDAACKELRMNRTEAISEAIRFLPKLIGNEGKVIRRDTYLRSPWMDDDEQT